MRWPGGFTSSGISCGIKIPPSPDLGLLAGAGPWSWTGTFTQNPAAAAPVHWCRERLGRPIRGLVVNSGNANACTGPTGVDAVQTAARAAAGLIGCTPEEVLVASTGPIGVELPIGRLVAALPHAVESLDPSVGPFAEAILTTDTVTKTARATAAGAQVVGVAKGAAMLAPNMATMLAFVATDAAIPDGALTEVLQGAVEATFNRISIDACESTNDSVFLLSSGAVGDVGVTELATAVTKVCGSLAEQIVADAEGASKIVRIGVRGGTDDAHAAGLARSVAASALWRAAVHGADPNWGRVISALGGADRSLVLDEVSVAIGGEWLFVKGQPSGSLAVAAAAMQAPEFRVECVVGSGRGGAEVLSTDLSPEYVTLNAGGMS